MFCRNCCLGRLPLSPNNFAQPIKTPKYILTPHCLKLLRPSPQICPIISPSALPFCLPQMILMMFPVLEGVLPQISLKSQNWSIYVFVYALHSKKYLLALFKVSERPDIHVDPHSFQEKSWETKIVFSDYFVQYNILHWYPENIALNVHVNIQQRMHFSLKISQR